MPKTHTIGDLSRNEDGPEEGREVEEQDEGAYYGTNRIIVHSESNNPEGII